MTLGNAPRIDKLKGLDTLTDLNCLSIGNNQITDLLSSLQVHWVRI